MNKKRICFISLTNLYLCPYINKYIENSTYEFDVIYWDRHDINDNVGQNESYRFRYKMDECSSNMKKLGGYFKFRKYALNILKRKNYDFIVLLQTSVGMIMYNKLIHKYRGRYILDIRDYTMENNIIFYMLEKILIRYSKYTIISSEGYREFLPKFNYINVHNDCYISDMDIKKFEGKVRNRDKIVISYIGLVRFHEENKKNILKFKNDKRFLLKFIGKGAFELKEFCKENNIKNVELIDIFPPEKTLEYYYDSDIIYNLYGNKNPLLDYALSNKLYYAAKLRIPILVCKETYMEKVAIENGFGFVFDRDDDEILDKLFDYYNQINWKKFYNDCKKFIDIVNKENKKFNNIIKNIGYENNEAINGE